MATLIDNDNKKLVDALKNVLPQTETIDILTAYFYFSGFSMLADELADKKIRILVGKSIDPNAVADLSAALKNDADLNQSQRQKEYTDSFIELFNKSALSTSFDDTDDQKMQKIFEEKLKDGSLEIKLTNEPNHAKTYILTNKPEFSQNGDYKGNIFMGSSNFTYSGLTRQGELNDSYKDNADYDKYSAHFDKLWNDSKSIDIMSKAINKSIDTPTLSSLSEYLQQNDLKNAVSDFSKALSYEVTEAANIAFLKEAPRFSEFVMPNLAPSLRSAIKNLNKSTAKRFASVDGIEFDTRNMLFFLSAEPDSSSGIEETNIIASSLEILGGISEQKMVDFLNHCAKFPRLELDHPVGRLIFDTVCSWDMI